MLSGKIVFFYKTYNLEYEKSFFGRIVLSLFRMHRAVVILIVMLFLTILPFISSTSLKPAVRYNITSEHEIHVGVELSNTLHELNNRGNP